MIKRSKCENKGKVPSKMELVLEYTQQGASHEVSKPGQYICCQNHKLIADIEDDIIRPSDAMHNPSQPFASLLKETVSFVIETNIGINYLTTLKHPSDTKDHLKMEMEMEIPSSSNVKLITECSDTTYTCYEVMKDLIKVSKLPQTLISYSSSQVHKMAIDY
ncbi:hypothetical protein Tco_0676525 [Tanacetum coccineum]